MIDKYFTLARERYAILLKKRAGLPKPWTVDPIFQKNRFCNVFREDDKTTVWLRENIRQPLRMTTLEVLLAITIFRWFNKIEIGEVIKECLLDSVFNVGILKEKILDKYPKGPFVTGSYIIKTPDNMNKLDGVLWCIDTFQRNAENGMFDKIIECGASMQEACGLLQQSPYLGKFMAYQICCDARFTCLLENAPDLTTWAQPGPGSTRGLGRIFYNYVYRFNNTGSGGNKEMISLMQELLHYSQDARYWPDNWPRWEMADVQNWCCEYDKYCRVEEGGRMKRKWK